MNWRELKLGDIADMAAESFSKARQTGAAAAKEAAAYLTNTDFGTMADDAKKLAAETARQAQNIIQKAPKETLGAAGLGAAATTVGGAGIASGGSAVAGSVVLGIGVPFIGPTLATAALAGGAALLARKAWQKTHNAAIPPAEPVGDWALNRQITDNHKN